MIAKYLTRTQGRHGPSTSDVLMYVYLTFGTLIMFGPIMWLLFSSFKTESALARYPNRLLPYSQVMVEVEGRDKPLPLFEVTMEDGTVKQLVQFGQPLGNQARMLDPANPDEFIDVAIDKREPINEVRFAWRNYTKPLTQFNFVRYFSNSLFVTGVATFITLTINSMAAFALSKYRFPGRDVIFVIIIATLMIPISVILVPAFLVITELNMTNTLWGVIIPGAATPTGVFLLRQYMLTIPDELLDSARIDGASEWRVYWQIVLPLARPALAVLAIFSVMWRWNDFLWPLIVLSESEVFTLQVGLNSFRGQHDTQWHYILAMTVLTLLPITVVFAFLQRFITTGIATTGMK
jgi:alpha-1,4-digalacturonate transport system permease protein